MFSVKSLRFAAENEKLLFQTHRLNVYQTGDLENQNVHWGQLTEIWGGVHGVFQDAFNPQTPETAKPSKEVGGLRLELGGHGGFDAQKLRTSLTSWFRSSFTGLMESTFVFFKKLWATVWGAQDKLATAGRMMSGLFTNVVASSPQNSA